jgi:hypothetical protein
MATPRVPVESIRLPPGFQLRVRGSGPDLGGFANVTDQETAVFTQGRSHRDFNESLRISVADASESSSLIGSGERPGAVVSQLRGAKSALYQDGMWVLLEGASQVDPADLVVAGDGIKIYWDRSVAHSMTMETALHRYGIFASKNFVSYPELVDIGQSLLDSEAGGKP